MDRFALLDWPLFDEPHGRLARDRMPPRDQWPGQVACVLAQRLVKELAAAR